MIIYDMAMYIVLLVHEINVIILNITYMYIYMYMYILVNISSNLNFFSRTKFQLSIGLQKS